VINVFNKYISKVDNTKVLCPLFHKTEISTLDDSPSISHLWTKCEILIRYGNEEDWLFWSSSSNLCGCAKALCPFHSSTKFSHWLDSEWGLRYFFM